MSTSLANQKILIVGGSSGIGFATALAAADQGAQVTIASHDRNKLREAHKRLPGNVDHHHLDIRDVKTIDNLFADRGTFDHIVISAAATKSGPVRQLPLEEAYAAMDSKFWGAYRIARAARIQPTGSLTLISGFLSHRPSANAVLQGAINAALEGLMRGLALEFAPVRVNVVSPGLIDTPLYNHMAEEDRRSLFDSTRQRLPARRVGTPDDIAQAVLSVAGNPYTTGVVLTVDGGATIA